MMVREVLYVFGFSYLNNVYVASINWQLNLQSQVSGFILFTQGLCKSGIGGCVLFTSTKCHTCPSLHRVDLSLRAPVVDVSKGVSTIPSQSWSMSSCGTFSSRTCSSVVSVPGWFSVVAHVRVCPLTSMMSSGSVFLVSSSVSGG